MLTLPFSFNKDGQASGVLLTREAVHAIAVEMVNVFANTPIIDKPIISDMLSLGISEDNRKIESEPAQKEGFWVMCPLDGRDCTEECGYPTGDDGSCTGKCPFRVKKLGGALKCQK